MTTEELDKWFVHLQVMTKEKVTGLRYPHCTELWDRMTDYEKELKYLAFGGRNAHDHHKWKKGNTSYT